jgi:hypothetical protein
MGAVARSLMSRQLPTIGRTESNDTAPDNDAADEFPPGMGAVARSLMSRQLPTIGRGEPSTPENEKSCRVDADRRSSD